VPSIDLVILLAVVLCYSVIVKGARQTVAFFVITIVASYFCEYTGHHYGWVFGKYHYNESFGPRIGSVPILIILTWFIIIFASFMLIDWLVGMRGEKRVNSWWGKVLWSALIAAAAATLTCACDLMLDPFGTSKAWLIAANKKPFWYWFNGGPYLKGLPGGMGKNGIPIGNFVSWWLLAFVVVFVFYLFFQRPDRISGRLVNTIPILIYFYGYITIALGALYLNKYVNGMNQVALIGFFTMMPVILASVIKLVWEYT
jgi:putative membrane protein